MTKNINRIFIAGLMMMTVSCKKDLVEINRNPNATENPQPDYLLTASQKISSDLYWGADNNFNATLLIIQHWAKVQYTEPDRYIFSNSSFTSLWNTGYAQSITNLNTIIQWPDEKANVNYKNVALILRSWVFSLLTDAYGDIPYKQAGDIKNNFTPAYDTQKDVYYGLLDDLKKASAALTTTGNVIAGDIIFSGKIDRWKKFANALRFRIALRIADREPEKAKQTINEVLIDAGGLIGSNAETAQLVYSTSPQQNPVSAWFDTRDEFRIAKTTLDKLNALNDPRLPVYANKPTDTSIKTYVGVPSGLSTSAANNLGFAKTSRPGSLFFAPTSPAVIISYAEVLFDRAEAAARGFTTEDANTLYNAAITASLNQYGITDGTIISNYLSQTSVKYDATNYKKSIGEQKWIALYGQGLEAFAEWRRLDYPQLTPAVEGVLDKKIPVRFIYPGTEQSLNGDNYKLAVANQGTDNLLTKLWFDKY
ncbi:MAG TPA: SusD/RagB family nutrient-binding outer membrane lipoprotein [Niastella sp.]